MTTFAPCTGPDGADHRRPLDGVAGQSTPRRGGVPTTPLAHARGRNVSAASSFRGQQVPLSFGLFSCFFSSPLGSRLIEPLPGESIGAGQRDQSRAVERDSKKLTRASAASRCDLVGALWVLLSRACCVSGGVPDHL